MTLRFKDTIEGKISNATNADAVPWSGVSGKPSTFTPSSHTHDDRYYTESEINSKLSGKANSSHTHTKSQISDFPSKLEPYFANHTWYVVGDDAAIGDHDKAGAFCVKGLNDTPNISLYNSDDSYYGQCITSADIGSQSVNYANSAGSVAWSHVSGRPSSMPASDVYNWAKASSKPSYSWSEISGKPTIPSVGNGTVTIKQNGATKGTFTLNQAGNATIELTDNNTVYSLPTATSSVLGGVKVGSNITNSSGTISLTKANVTAALGYTPPTSDTNTWRPEEVIISSTQPSASTCKLWIKI